MTKTNSSKIFVALGSELDPIRFNQLSNAQKLASLFSPRGLLYYEVPSLRYARSLLMEFIKYFDIGGNEFSGGMVVDENWNEIAYISYNGRVWGKEDCLSEIISY